MEDQFEKHIASHRTQFNNIENVREEIIWKGIENELNKNKFKKWTLVIFLISIVIVGLAYLLIGHQLKHEPETFPVMMAEMVSVTKEYEEMTKSKMSSINVASLKDPRFDDLLASLKELDERHQQLLLEIKTKGLNEHMISKMIKYHERKLRILELLMKEKEYQNLEKIKAYEI